jgi:hypothetical protein
MRCGRLLHGCLVYTPHNLSHKETVLQYYRTQYYRIIVLQYYRTIALQDYSTTGLQ